jgi:hypothetical protein
MKLAIKGSRDAIFPPDTARLLRRSNGERRGENKKICREHVHFLKCQVLPVAALLRPKSSSKAEWLRQRDLRFEEQTPWTEDQGLKEAHA